ncbi:MAG: rhodanese-like domain-containing protein [Saprospiraceae bacterium]
MHYLKITVFALLFCAACSNNATSDKSAGSYQDLNVTEFKAQMSDPNVVILDVRTPGEIAEGKIPNALEIDIQSPDFKQRIEALDKDKTYLVYCKKGGRSARACSAMQELGFGELYNLEGGFTAFSAE